VWPGPICAGWHGIDSELDLCGTASVICTDLKQ